MKSILPMMARAKIKRHKELMQIVRDNYAVFNKSRLALGSALIELCDGEYWKDTHTSFKDYCEENFSISDNYARRLMDGAYAKAELPVEHQSKITTESQARALINVPQSKRSEVLEEASKNGHVTAKSIHEAAEKVVGQNVPIGTPSDPVAPIQNRGKNDKIVVFDKVGTVVPDDALPYWNRRQEVQTFLSQISKLRTAIKSARESKDSLWVRHGQESYEYLSRAYSYISDALPYAVCLQCQGSYTFPEGGCSTCGNTGFISEYRFEHFLPKELREIRLKSNHDLAKKYPQSPLNKKLETTNVH